MRPLTEPETKTLFEKLATYCGKGITNLIADPTGGSDRNVFRVQVYTPITQIPRKRFCLTLFTPGLKSLLRARIPRQPRHLRRTRQPPLAGHLSGKIHKDGEIPTTHHSTACDCAARTV